MHQPVLLESRGRVFVEPVRPAVVLQLVADNAQLLAIALGLLAILSAGAYGMAMSSNYNTRPRAAEVLIDGDKTHLVRERETVARFSAPRPARWPTWSRCCAAVERRGRSLFFRRVRPPARAGSRH